MVATPPTICYQAFESNTMKITQAGIENVQAARWEMPVLPFPVTNAGLAVAMLAVSGTQLSSTMVRGAVVKRLG